MSEMKSRPESRQKKAGSETEEGKSSADGKKISPQKPLTKLTDVISRVKSAKSSKSLVKGDTKTVRMFIGKCKQDRPEEADDVEEKQKLRNEKIWDEKLEKLALKRKRVSVIDREIGLKQIRIIPASPLIENVAVKRKCVKKQSDLSALELKAAHPGAELMKPNYKGPRYDPLGRIIPHSILGDVESFLKHSGQAAKVSNILLVHPSETRAVVHKSSEETSMFNNPLLNQGNALRTWKTEMEMRCEEQNRLAGILNCREKDLLMCKSETRADKELINILQYEDWSNDPRVCFWRLAQHCTAGHLHETLPKSARGQLPTPVLSGDADTILKEKGKTCDAELCKRLKDDTVQERIQSVKGTIQIANKVLFDKLLLQGEVTDARGGNVRNVKNVKFENGEDIHGTSKAENADVENTYGSVFSKFFAARRMSKVVRQTRELMKFKGISAEPDDDFCGEAESAFFNRSRRGTLHKHIAMLDKLSRSLKDTRTVLDFKFIGPEREEVDGPALFIDGTTLQWCGSSGSEEDGNSISMEVFVLIKGEPGEMLRGCAQFENVGTTVIRYSWQRVPENRPLPVPRPHRRFFYFLDDQGVMLPKETVSVPVLFKSQIPGYFTESWLLSTQPELEGGAKVKFTFKAIARYEPDFSRQFQDIEDYLKEKEAQTLCSLQTKSILDYALLKASLKPGCLRYDPVEPSIEEMFVQTNPGLYYYAHVIRRLQLLCESFIPETEHRKLENGVLVVSVSSLWKAYLALPDDDVEGDSDSEDQSYTNLTRKQMLLWQLYSDISTLSFRPIVLLQSSFQLKCMMMYTMLQTGIDHMVSFAHDLANSLRLVPKEEAKETDNTQKQDKKGKKNKGKPNSSKGGKKGKSPEEAAPVPEPTVSPEVPKLVFSAADKFRTDNAEKFCPELAQYDEKVYLEVYSMLINTIEEMSVLLEDM
ncbi:uncharacterized protein LOC128551272 isoform X2 [Mercenaria mercenaria]|uniref:uncharacterized protein LOC128551272 isoform X2 n=1 Tax=Mercenaria mercenaria TaxID=6596 RepID=UPI00234F98B7|nr:uncharacterized protein LOC128551272 isoform X2 [Mercenaria mercenaria]